eukprot:g5859.t1
MVSLLQQQWGDRTFQDVLYQPLGVEEPLLVQHHRGLLNMTMNPTKYENASVFHQTEWVDVDTITINLCGNLVLLLLVLTYFWSSRRHYPSFFSCKRYFLPDQTPPDLPSSGFLSWILPLMAFPEDDILMYAGFDAAIFLRFYAVAFKVFALFAPYGLLVLIPVNLHENKADERHESNINTFNRLSMSNIQHYDSRMWLHAIGMYLLSALAMYFLVVEYRYYTNLRHRFLRRKSAHLRTIVVQGVPREMRSDSKLFTYFNTLYPEEVVNVHIPQNLSVLRRLIRERQVVLENLGKGLAEKGVRGEEQYHYTGGWCSRRRRVNTVGFCSTQLDRLNLAIATEQDRRRPPRRRRSGWGPTLPSISSVDMSYELGTKPDKAGPIERVVLQEDLDEEDEEDIDADAVDDDAGSGGGEEGNENDVLGASEARRGEVGGDGSGSSASPRLNGMGNRSAADAMAEAEAEVVDISSEVDAMEAAREGGPGTDNQGFGPEAEVVTGPDGLDYDRSSAKTLQQYQEGYWGKGYQSVSGESGGEGGWGSTIRPSMAPRLSVDLINVDPVKELVKTTAQQTFHTMRARSRHYRSAKNNASNGGTGTAAAGGAAAGGGYGTAAMTDARTPPKKSGSNGSLSGSGKRTAGSPMVVAGGTPGVNEGAGIGGSGSSSSGLRRSWSLGRANGSGSESMSLLGQQQAQQDRHYHRKPMAKKGKGYSSRAFVTFRSFGAATVARQVLHCARPGRMAASSAPEPRDVYWPNAIVTRRQHTARRVCVEVLLGVLMLLFPVLVTMLSFVFSAENLMQRSEVVRKLCRRSSLFESMIELIQPMAVITVMATLPLLLRLVGRLEGTLAESWIQMQTLSRYFTFQVLNVFLVTTIAGFAVEILTQQLHAQIVKRLVDDPSVLFTLLGETLPKVCGFFCDYVIIRAFTGMSMELVRAYSLFPALIAMVTKKKKWGRSMYSDAVEARSQRFDSQASNASSVGGGVGKGVMGYGMAGRHLPIPGGGYGGARGGRGGSSASGSASPVASVHANRVPMHPGGFYYGQMYAQDLLVVVVVMTYACVAPVVIVPALMFFFMAQVVYRHQLLYVYVPTFESGGSFFPKMFRRWIFALFTAQATMVGMCLLKQGFKQAYSVMFLMVLTYVYKRKVRSTYEPVSFSLPLEIARGLDLDRAESGPEGQEEDEALHPAADEYLQPELREPAFVSPEDIFQRRGGGGGGGGGGIGGGDGHGAGSGDGVKGGVEEGREKMMPDETF